MFKTLRSRLWLTYALVIGVVLGVVGLAIFVYLFRNPPSVRFARARLAEAASEIRSNRWPLDQPDRLVEPFRQFSETSGVRLILLAADGSTVIDSAGEENPQIPGLRLNTFGSNQFPIQEFRDDNGKRWLYTGFTSQAGYSLVLAMQRPRGVLLSVLADELFRPLFQAGLLAMLLSLVFAFLISRWVAAPLQRMAAAARVMEAGEHRSIKIDGPYEVRSLARAFNEMTSQMHASQKSQRDFVANVSHELKTPLTSIQGFAQAILDGTAENPETLQQAARVIYDESGRMHRMVVDLLDLARLDAGTANMQRAALDLSELLFGVTRKFTPQSQEAKVDLRTEIESLPGFIGDGDRLAQVFTNLIDNALKHTPPGGRVTVAARQVGDQVEVSVEDTGSGIQADELSRIFERFYQLDKSRRGGTERSIGLGLTIAREIIHSHGGEIYAQSEPGKGSNFVVRMPVAQPDDTTLVTERKKILERKT
ncbi:MAG: HAMP domain-containing histidine kinase [Chloroflexi bacterium]|nr:HAMP domain-containing histidine kinase [Chloroflexota bacterium]